MALISCTVTVQLTCTIVFAYAKIWFSYWFCHCKLHHILYELLQYQNVVELNWPATYPRSPYVLAIIYGDYWLSSIRSMLMKSIMRKPAICIRENKRADQLAVTTLLISCFVFAIWYIQQFLYFLNPKFGALTVFCGWTGLYVSHLVENPEDRFFSSAVLMVCYVSCRWKN